MDLHRDGASGGLPVRTDDPRVVLGHVSGGRVLDAATGDGQFIRFLLEGLKDHGPILGIDSAPVEQPLFVERFKDHPDISFELRDVLDPRLTEASFDTVSIANSICVFEDRRGVLARLIGLLRPGGHLVVVADYRDHQDDAQAVYVRLHDWWAAVDRAQGKPHHASQRQAQLIGLVSGLGLADLRLFEVDAGAADPMDPAVIASIDGVIDRCLQQVAGHPALQARGEVLRQRMHGVGFRSASALVAVGRADPKGGARYLSNR